MFRINSISVVGLGKLGACLAAVLAERGFEVIGIDVDKGKVNSINSGEAPIYEPGLQDLLKKNQKKIRATTDYSNSINRTDATFVVVPTPSEEDGSFSLRFVEPAMKQIGIQLRNKRSYHLVVVTSTVGPGSMDFTIKPALEKASGKVIGKELGLCYNPEFIALGDVIHGMLEPDFILIGESDAVAGDNLSEIQRKICINNPPIERMEFMNAELAKIAVNSFITMKMSFANTLAEICEKFPMGNVDKVTKAIGRDKRIGSAYLKGAIGYGGPCFPRDNIAFAFYAKKLSAQADIALATHQVNVKQVSRIMSLAEKHGLSRSKKVGVLGLAYKPNTNVVEQSQSLQIAQELSVAGYRVNVFDPAAMENSSLLLNGVVFCKSAEECVKNSDFVILATPWPEFQSLPANIFKGKVVLDCWRFLPNEVSQVSHYFSIGLGDSQKP